jgi:hypothetical protein
VREVVVRLGAGIQKDAVDCWVGLEGAVGVLEVVVLRRVVGFVEGYCVTLSSDQWRAYFSAKAGMSER